ncbi:N-acetyltransferase [Synergistales bacterium]|nr:N-acetyltransferase [Synergistales bacterium]
MNIEYKGFLISDDKSKIQIDRICELLSTTYWAEDRKKEAIEKSIENSMCFGVYADKRQIGFARCVTDYATMFWLADVIIDEKYRKLGIGKALIKFIVEHNLLQSLFGILGTRDAHSLYAQYGFQTFDGRFMRKPANDL